MTERKHICRIIWRAAVKGCWADSFTGICTKIEILFHIPFHLLSLQQWLCENGETFRFKMPFSNLVVQQQRLHTWCALNECIKHDINFHRRIYRRRLPGEDCRFCLKWSLLSLSARLEWCLCMAQLWLYQWGAKLAPQTEEISSPHQWIYQQLSGCMLLCQTAGPKLYVLIKQQQEKSLASKQHWKKHASGHN